MSLGRHTLVNLAGTLAPMFVSILTVPVYLRLIGPERYGVLAILWTLLAYFSFFDMGLGRALAQRMASRAGSNPAERSNLAWTALATSGLLSIGGSVALWVSADWLLLHLFELAPTNLGEALAGARWLVVLLPLSMIGAAMNGALQAQMRFVELNSAQFIGTILGQLIPLATAASGRTSLDFLILAVVFARLLTFAIVGLLAKRHVPLQRPTFDSKELRHLLHYGAWSSLASLVGPLLVTIDRFAIAASSGADSVAFYTIPYDLAVKAMVVSSAVASALAPRLASDQLKGHQLANETTLTLGLAMAAPVTAAILLANPFLQIWLKSTQAAQSQGVAEWILLGVWLHAVVTPHHARIMAQGGPRLVLGVYLLQLPVYLPLLALSIRLWGVQGAASAWAFRVALDLAAFLALSKSLHLTRSLAAPGGVVLIALFVSLTELTTPARVALGATITLLAVYTSAPTLRSIVRTVRR